MIRTGDWSFLYDIYYSIPSAIVLSFRKTIDSSEDKELFITQNSTKAKISAEIEGNVV